MRIPEKENGALMIITSVGIVDPASSCRQANLAEVFAAVHACCTVVFFNLEYIEALELKLTIEGGDRGFSIHFNSRS